MDQSRWLCRALGWARSRSHYLLHLLPILWLFGGALAGQGVLYFRDLSSAFVPDYSFLSSSLRQGVWPLFNPLVDGGSPCLFTYPVDLVLVALLGPLGPLRVGVPLHLFVAMTGATALARQRGAGPPGAWLAGTVYGLSGVVLSLVNLLPLLHAAAWAPWMLRAFANTCREPGARPAAGLALVAALGVSTLGADILLQAALVAAVLIPGADRVTRRAWPWLLLALGLTLVLSAPMVGGAAALLGGSARARGFPAAQVLDYSLPLPALLDMLLPRFFGDVHALSDQGYFGQPFFTQGYPYLLSLYLGPMVLGLAAVGGGWRGLGLFACSVSLALGQNGLFGPWLFGSLRFVRFPVKFLWTATLVLALLAGAGLERAERLGFRARVLIASAALLPLALALGAALAPDRVVSGLVALFPAVVAERAREVVAQQWPTAFLPAAALPVAAALGLRFRRGGLLLGALLAVDLLAGNALVNTFASPVFYALQPDLRAAVEPARQEGSWRWFSYGLADSGGVRLHPALRGDAWLYLLDRQALFPRAQALDGLEGIFDVDRTGWAPDGATLGKEARHPSAYRTIHPLLRVENVRFVMSFSELPADLVALRAEVRMPEVLSPLRLYELRDPLARAVVLDSEARVPALGSSVRYARLNAHEVRLQTSGPPGFVAVRDPWRPELTATLDGRPLLLARWGRHFGMQTPGGDREIRVRFRPAWRVPALILSALGFLALALIQGMGAVRSWRSGVQKPVVR